MSRLTSLLDELFVYCILFAVRRMSRYCVLQLVCTVQVEDVCTVLYTKIFALASDYKNAVLYFPFLCSLQEIWRFRVLSVTSHLSATRIEGLRIRSLPVCHSPSALHCTALHCLANLSHF